MLSPSETVHRWLASPFTDPRPQVQAAINQLEHYAREDRQHYLDWEPQDLEQLLQLVDQQRLEFADDDKHENVRRAVARFLETVVLPASIDPKVRRLPDVLRGARQTCTRRYRRSDHRFITIYDNKAGVPLLDPDDAREEAQRVQRRVVPAVLEALREHGTRVYSCVFTVPNSGAGKLRPGMRALSRRFSLFLRRVKRGKSLPILGAYAVMEAPLGGYHDWHPHLNVILVTSGWFDFGKLRALWANNVHIERVMPNARYKTMDDAVAASLRELIKYAVRAVSEKSITKAGRAADLGAAPGRPAAPPMLEWTAAEWLEWWYAHRGFRRSRGYGCLFKLDDPEPETVDGFETIATGQRDSRGCMVWRWTLLESIPGDNSTAMTEETFLERYRRAIWHLSGPPDDARRCLSLATEAERAWQRIDKQLQ
jgi:hypothetical protein